MCFMNHDDKFPGKGPCQRRWNQPGGANRSMQFLYSENGGDEIETSHQEAPSRSEHRYDLMMRRFPDGSAEMRSTISTTTLRSEPKNSSSSRSKSTTKSWEVDALGTTRSLTLSMVFWTWWNWNRCIPSKWAKHTQKRR